VTDVVLDPRNPDIVVASAYQRRRHSHDDQRRPESAIHRKHDGGKTWKRSRPGCPTSSSGESVSRSRL